MTDWPTGKFGVVYADPPWHFKAWAEYKPLRSGGHTRAVQRYYDTMTPDELARLPISNFAAVDCVLFCWICWPNLAEAIDIIAKWGFTFKTCAFVWVKGEALPLFPDDKKAQIGLGYWTRANSEPCLLATRGHPKRLNADVSQIIFEKRREHSRKPDCVYERIERLVDGPYLELFARTTRPGWTSWGNETDKFKAAE